LRQPHKVSFRFARLREDPGPIASHQINLLLNPSTTTSLHIAILYGSVREARRGPAALNTYTEGKSPPPIRPAQPRYNLE
jgi:hypothetical protein